MKKIKKALLLALSLALSVTMFAACGFQSEASGTGSGNQTTDTGSSDTGSTDTGSSDTGSSDTGSTDTGSTDAPCEHTGGTATCTAKAECELCGEEYGEFAAHDYTVVKYDDDSHWNECACGAKDEESDVAHSGGTATCTAKAVCAVCEQAYGELAAHNYEEKYAYVGLMMVMNGGEWAIATEGGQAFGTLSSSYGYMPAVEVALGQRSFVSSVNVTYTFTQVGIASYTIQDTNGKYIYMKGTYDSFNVSATLPEEGGTWTIDTSEGLAKITNDLTGKWIQYSENFGTFGAYNTQKGVNVNVYGYNPDESYNPNRSDATNHWLECVCGEKKDVTAHDYSVTKKDATNHWNICSVCGVVDENSVVAHNFNIPKTSDTQHWNECECGRYDNKVNHTLESKYDATQHWQVCDCSYETEKTAHTLTYAYENHQHWQVCDCGYETEKVDCLYMSEDEETAMSCVKYDAEKHWIQCICGQELVMVDEGLTGPHWWEDDYDSMCDFCGYTREIKITLEDAVIVEQVAGKFTLPDEVRGNVQSVNIGELAFTGINGKEVAIGANELVAQAELGEGKTMIVVTDVATYTIPANVYTMVIDNKAELKQWQAVAADNSVKAGLCVEDQKKAILTGYFALGANIEYNDVWTPILSYGNPGIWSTISNENYINELKEKYAGDEAALSKIIYGEWTDPTIAGFRGVFDGNGHYINGLWVESQYGGFVVVNGDVGVIKDVAFTNACIGSMAGLVTNRGGGTIENVYVQVASIANGNGAADPTCVISRQGDTEPKYYSNIVVDISAIDYKKVEYAYVADLSGWATNGIYVIGAPADVILSRGVDNYFSEESAEACLFSHLNNVEGTDYDVAYGFATAADLIADATHGAVVAKWAEGGFWTVDAENGKVLPTSLVNTKPIYVQKPSIVCVATDQTNVSAYDGDVTALGFAAGTYVNEVAISDGWYSRVRITTDNVNADYISIDFSIAEGTTVNSFTIWPEEHGGSYNVGASGVLPNGADTRTIFVLDANGKDVTKGPWAANTVYTLRYYLAGATTTCTKFTISTFNTGSTIYFGNIKSVVDKSEPMFDGNGGYIGAYKGDETTLGFEKGTYVYDYNTTSSEGAYSNRVAIAPASGTNMVRVDFVFPEVSTGFIVFKAIANVSVARAVDVDADGLANWAFMSSSERKTDITEAQQMSDIAVYEKATGALVSTVGWKANTVYTVELYHDGAYTVWFGFKNANSHVYFANIEYLTVDDSDLVKAKPSGMAIPVYTGDVTKLGFAAGTTVYAYGTPTADSAYGNTGATYGATQYWGMDIATLVKDGVLTFKFMLPELPTTNMIFAIWSNTANSSNPHIQINMNGPQKSTDTYTVVTTDASGNTVSSLEAGVVYTMTITFTDTTATGGYISYVNYADTGVMYVAK